MGISKPSGKKIIYVEILRIIAILFVIFNHTGDDGFTLFAGYYGTGSLCYWFFMMISIIIRVNVPLFLMISGMLLLGKDETISYIWKKRIPFYAVALAVFSFINYFRSVGYNISSFSLFDFAKKLYTGSIAMPYWYIYLYIAFLIALPFLRSVAKELSEKRVIYLLILQLLFNGILVIIQFLVAKKNGEYEYHINPAMLTADVVFYPLIGYYLGNKVKKIKGKNVLVFAGLSVISVAISMFMTWFKYFHIGETGDVTKPFFDALRAITSIFVFLLVRFIFEERKMPYMVEKALFSFGGCVFGIYLIEEIVKMDLWFIFENMTCGKPDMFLLWVYILIVFFVSFAIVWPVKFLFGSLKKLMFRKTSPDNK